MQTTLDSMVEANLCNRAVAGDQVALSQLLEMHHGLLLRLVRLRMPNALRTRVDEEDVVQEAFLEATRCIDKFTPDPNRPFYLWLRQIAYNKLLETQRSHLGTDKRDANRESILGAETSLALADVLVASITSPSLAAMRAEMMGLLELRLGQLDDVDREVLILRHFEQLSTSEAAQVLGISKSAAGKRYLKALDRLRDLMSRVAEVSRR